MKAVFIVYNQGMTGEVFEALESLGVRGFTQWESVRGRGSETGEPRMGTHTWPSLNNALMSIVTEEEAHQLLEKVKELNKEMPEQGIKAFSWKVDGMV
ncbi:P-II family nitrogen regulator [Cytophagaceae bacterium ABcell3]|nr:P-II family nitrogen regulator [Cytophagaceae bacterium ABcell3]